MSNCQEICISLVFNCQYQANRKTGTITEEMMWWLACCHHKQQKNFMGFFVVVFTNSNLFPVYLLFPTIFSQIVGFDSRVSGSGCSNSNNVRPWCSTFYSQVLYRKKKIHFSVKQGLKQCPNGSQLSQFHFDRLNSQNQLSLATIIEKIEKKGIVVKPFLLLKKENKRTWEKFQYAANDPF